MENTDKRLDTQICIKVTSDLLKQIKDFKDGDKNNLTLRSIKMNSFYRLLLELGLKTFMDQKNV